MQIILTKNSSFFQTINVNYIDDTLQKGIIYGRSVDKKSCKSGKLS